MQVQLHRLSRSRVRIPPVASAAVAQWQSMGRRCTEPRRREGCFVLVVLAPTSHRFRRDQFFQRSEDTMTESLNSTIVPTGEATAILPVAGGRMKPVTVIGTAAIRDTFDELCLQQAINSR